MAGAQMTLTNVARVLYVVYYGKFFLAFLQPQIAQQFTEFCHSCNLSGDSGTVAAAHETWAYFFVALIYTAVAQFDDKKCQRKVIQYGMTLFGAKLFVLFQFGRDALGAESNNFYTAVAENLLLLILSSVACYVWNTKKAPHNFAVKADLTDHRTAVRICYVEQLVLALASFYALYNGEADKVIPNDGGVFSLALSSATQLGISVTLMGVAQCNDDQMRLVVQYFMAKKVIDLFYISALTAPFAIAAGGENGIMGVYIMTGWSIISTVHMMCCAYHAPIRRAAFWAAGLLVLFLGVLGLAFPSTTAAAVYRVDDLNNAPQVVFKIVGLGCVLIGAALMAFAKEFNMDSFESTYSIVYGGICLYCVHNDLYMGVFTEISNVFLLWCLWQSYAASAMDAVKPFVPSFLAKSVKKAHAATSPKGSPIKAAAKKAGRGRSKTPGGKKKN